MIIIYFYFYLALLGSTSIYHLFYSILHSRFINDGCSSSPFLFYPQIMDSSLNCIYSSDSGLPDSENESISVSDIKRKDDDAKEKANPGNGDVTSGSRKRNIIEPDSDSGEIIFIGEFCPKKKKKKKAPRIDSVLLEEINPSEVDSSDYEELHYEEHEDSFCGVLVEREQTVPSYKQSRSKSPPEQTVIRVDVQQLKCSLHPVCERTFDSRTELNRHLILDHDFNPYLCPIGDCPESFEKRPLVYQHVANQHSNVVEFRCPTVNRCRTRVYTNFRKYYLHMVKFHEVNQFLCPRLGCDFSATYRLTLHKHIAKVHQSHENIEPK